MLCKFLTHKTIIYINIPKELDEKCRIQEGIVVFKHHKIVNLQQPKFSSARIE